MKKALVLAVAVLGMAAVGANAWAACGGGTPVGHALDSFFVGNDGVPVQAMIYEVAAPTTDNSGILQVDCQFTGQNQNPGFLCVQTGSGGVGDTQFTIETDAFLSPWVGCPAPPGVTPKRIVSVATDGNGNGNLLTISGQGSLAYAFEYAHPFDGETISPISLNTRSGRPRIVTMTTAGGSATVTLHQDRPRINSDCDPGTFGEVLGDSCVDGFVATLTLGNLYTRTAACPNQGVPRTDASLSGTTWTRTATTTNAAGDSTITVTQPPAGSCVYIGGGVTLNGVNEFLGGYIALPAAGAASPRAEEVRVAKGQGGRVNVSWVSRSELNLASYKVMTDKKGLVDVATVSPLGGGGAATYSVNVDMNALKGGKSIVVRAVLNDGTTVDSAPVGF